jgi:4-diphosphocytidyl-2-C-methyl-D-erythritol kinase
LNALSPDPLDSDALLGLAGALGADVPFLTQSAPFALAWGRGDRILALPPLPSREVSLVTFPFGVATSEAFGWIAEERRENAHTVSGRAIEAGALESWEGVAALASNDFEAEVADRHPPIAAVLQAARALEPLMAGLTGSGATVVILPRERADPGRLVLAPGARLLRTRTAGSVEDIRLTG